MAFGRGLLTSPRILLRGEISLGLALRPSTIFTRSSRDQCTLHGRRHRRAGHFCSLAVADRFHCLLEGRMSLSGRPAEASRKAVMQHYFGVRRRDGDRVDFHRLNRHDLADLIGDWFGIAYLSSVGEAGRGDKPGHDREETPSCAAVSRVWGHDRGAS